MSHTIPSLDLISAPLGELALPRKPKVLVVDDEPDNLDLLYRTFRREFSVLRAESGAEALEILAHEGEVAVIISDQRMPEMKGTEFLSKTVPQFPDTVRIILTGFTDVEDLVEAINTGQVYKYITKPWNPAELKDMVVHATETYRVLKQHADSVYRAQLQAQLLNTILQEVEREVDLEQRLQNLAIAIGQGFGAAVCVLRLIRPEDLAAPIGLYQDAARLPIPLPVEEVGDDPVLQEAIATADLRLLVNADADSALGQHPYYAKTGIKSQFIIPLLSKRQVMALLTLQWTQPLDKLGITKDDIELIHFVAHQLALSLTCARVIQNQG